jgi:hypothetical protein
MARSALGRHPALVSVNRITLNTVWGMNFPPPQHPPRQIERLRDDDTPGAPPWPWQPAPSGQAARADRQQLADLEPMGGR